MIAVLSVSQISKSFNISVLIKLTTHASMLVDIAKYFSSGCMYVLIQPTDQDVIHMQTISDLISRPVLFWKPATITSFDKYYDMLNTTSNMDQCNVPLQVIPLSDNKTKEAFIAHSRKTSMHGTDQYGGGAWLIFLNTFDSGFIENFFEDVNTPFDVELLVAWIDGEQVHMKEIYRVSPEFPLQQPYFGNWTKGGGLIAPQNPLPYSRRSNLEGFQMRVGVVTNPPITQLKSINGKTYIGGYFGEIWNVLQSAINISTVLKKFDFFGQHQPGKKIWTGLMGEIQHGRLNIAVSDVTLTRSRIDYMDFTSPLIVTNFEVYFKHPGSVMEMEALFLPLAYDLWLTLLLWLAMGSVIFFCACRISNAVMNTKERFSMIKSFFFFLGVLCGQGSSDVPKKASCRILFFMPFVITSVLIPSYSASLISYLRVMPTVVPFSNMKQFYERGTYRMVVKKQSTEYELLSYETISNNYIQLIYERDIQERGDLPESYIEAIELMCRNKRVALYALYEEMEYILNTKLKRALNGCIITSKREDGGAVSLGMILPKRSHFTGLIKHHLRNLHTSGVIARLKKKYWYKFKKLEKDNWAPVTVENALTIFLILGCGIVIGIILLAVEMIGASRCNDTLMNR